MYCVCTGWRYLWPQKTHLVCIMNLVHTASASALTQQPHGFLTTQHGEGQQRSLHEEVPVLGHQVADGGSLKVGSNHGITLPRSTLLPLPYEVYRCRGIIPGNSLGHCEYAHNPPHFAAREVPLQFEEIWASFTSQITVLCNYVPPLFWLMCRNNRNRGGTDRHDMHATAR